MMVAGATCLSSKDGIAKMLVTDHHPLSILWVHYLFIWLALAPLVAARQGVGALLPRPFGWQLLRATLSMTTVLLFFNAIRFIPLANAHAMVFIGPLIATALSPFLLGEHVGLRRASAVAVGLAGILFILRPDFEGQGLGYLLALGAGVSVALFFLVNRRAAGMASPTATVMHSVSVGAVVLAPLQPFIWQDFSGTALWLLIVSAVIALAGQALAILSFGFGEASLIAIFHYFGIVASTAFGLIVFGDFPDPVTWAGIALVISSGVYIALRERKLGRKPKVR